MSKLRQNGFVSAAVAGAGWTIAHWRSETVRNWSQSRLPAATHSPIYSRAGGDGGPAVILLHGLVSTGDVFGAGFDELATDNTLVVPDLLGFGRSLDDERGEFTIDDHLDALDSMATEAGLFDKRWIIGAHSMGSAVALAWANRHHGRVDRVVCWGAPIYSSPEVARREISGSIMARLFALDTGLAERACMLSCRHRELAGWLTAGLQPSLPVPIARTVSQHSWPAYRDAMHNLVIQTNWKQQLRSLDEYGTTVELYWGSNDPVGDRPYALTLVEDSENLRFSIVQDVDHHLPMSNPSLCVEHLVRQRQELAG